MDKTTRSRRAIRLTRKVPSGNLLDGLEQVTTFDRPIRSIAKTVRRKIGPGPVRDTLHGVPIGHPLHPSLATIGIGCWVAAAVLDWTRADGRAARVLLATGIGTALPTAAAGLTDWSTLHREQQRVGFVHALTNATATGLYTASLLLRMAGKERAGRFFSFAGLGAVLGGAYLGGHLAYRQAAGANHAESLSHLVPLGWHDLCALKDLPNGRPVTRRLGYIDLFVLRLGDGVTVLADRCSHLAGPLHQGRLVMEHGEPCVICPWHGSVFRISDGTVAHGPATSRQPAFQTRLRRDGTVQVRPAP
ncbi:Rieske 2Fe-2S domain-containing protein [Microtetraspora sp. AC03309]|uniref:Rieske 2Fe-2S domain-containing protein n=1 Tax=Microtetraspora sp. AC03309 TaxID=2779376 RepID=UPI001E49BA00|nr:Rieske 2Fe-2S domain-containing protein [Microtetraspora sp. AC03309]MCC5576607.1 Rieske 2Fe-2S domain-containing protein [Microtetraspora sp. AC03309]